MTNSGGIVQGKTENIWGIKELLRKRFQLAGNGALEQAMQRNYRNKHFSEVTWVQFTLAEGWTRQDSKSLLALHFYYFSILVLQKSDLSETSQKPEI